MAMTKIWMMIIHQLWGYDIFRQKLWVVENQAIYGDMICIYIYIHTYSDRNH